MSAIDTAIDKIIAEKNDAISKMEWWKKEARGEVKEAKEH